MSSYALYFRTTPFGEYLPHYLHEGWHSIAEGIEQRSRHALGANNLLCSHGRLRLDTEIS